MDLFFKTDNKPQTLELTVETSTPTYLFVKVTDANPAWMGTTYYMRGHTVRGKETFIISMPLTPDAVKIEVFNPAIGNISKPRTFRYISLEKKPLKRWKIKLSANDKEFIKLCEQFAQNFKLLSYGVYLSDKGNFGISYVPQLYYTDKAGRSTGVPMKGNPAQIGHKSKMIKINHSEVQNYTVPMILAICFHEYGHGFKNQKPASEVEADLNGLYFLLGLGYPRIEAMRAWIAVFDGSSENKNSFGRLNDLRIKEIRKYIEDFDNGKIVKPA